MELNNHEPEQSEVISEPVTQDSNELDNSINSNESENDLDNDESSFDVNSAKEKINNLNRDIHKVRQVKNQLKEELTTSQNRIAELEQTIFDMKTNDLFNRYKVSLDDKEAILSLPTLEQREQWAKRLADKQSSSKPSYNFGAVLPQKKEFKDDYGIPNVNQIIG